MSEEEKMKKLDEIYKYLVSMEAKLELLKDMFETKDKIEKEIEGEWVFLSPDGKTISLKKKEMINVE